MANDCINCCEEIEESAEIYDVVASVGKLLYTKRGNMVGRILGLRKGKGRGTEVIMEVSNVDVAAVLLLKAGRSVSVPNKPNVDWGRALQRKGFPEGKVERS